MALLLGAIPWLATAIGTLFANVFGFAAKFLTDRFARVLAGITVIGAVTLAFFISINTIISGLSYALPHNVALYAGLLLPSNVDEVLTAMASARALLWAYDWNVKILQYKFGF